MIPGDLVKSSRDHRQDIKGLAEALGALGRVPLDLPEDYLEIRGYDEISPATNTSQERQP